MNKRIRASFAAAVLAGVCLLAPGARSDDKARPAEPAGGGMDAAMADAWARMGAVTDHHKAMAPMAGKFTFTNSMLMAPGTPPIESQGTYEGKLIYGGRFLLSRTEGEMMGQKFEGMGVLGYDNVIGKHVSTWMDSISTGIMRSEGTCSDDGKTFTFEGEMPDPMAGGKLTKYKYEFKVESNDKFSLHWWSPNPANGEMFEAMVIRYTRAE